MGDNKSTMTSKLCTSQSTYKCALKAYSRRQSADQTTLDSDFVCEIALLNIKYKNLFHIFKLSLISDN